MENLIFIKELFTVIGSVTAILAILAAGVLWLIKSAVQRGKTFQLFSTLVKEVSAIRTLIDEKFTHNDAKHREHDSKFHTHDKRITKLEIITDAKDQTINH